MLSSALRPIGIRAGKSFSTPPFVKLKMNGAVDESEVGEALRKVPEKGATGRRNFFGVKAKIIGLRRQAFKQASGLVSAPDRQQSIDKPEAAYQKGTLSAGNAVRSPVPEDVISFAQLLPGLLTAPEARRFGAAFEAHRWNWTLQPNEPIACGRAIAEGNDGHAACDTAAADHAFAVHDGAYNELDHGRHRGPRT